MTINDEIIILANRIANDGKKPTVALVKGKLTTKVPLPAIISALKTWQHDPSFIALPQQEPNIKAEQTSEKTDNALLRKHLNEELALMKQEISELKQLIQTLITQQK